MCTAPNDTNPINERTGIPPPPDTSIIHRPRPKPRPKPTKIPLPPPPRKEIPHYDESIPKLVDLMPQFPGCEDFDNEKERSGCTGEKIKQFFRKNIGWDNMYHNGLQGTSFIRFIVEEDGSLSFHEDLSAVILREPGNGHGKEALRIAKLMPKWIPGKQDGKPTRVLMMIPCRFSFPYD